MTRTLLLLVGLYLVWRIATIVGRRRQRQQRAEFGRRGWTYGSSGGTAACSRCGRSLSADEVAWEGRLNDRRPVCAGGCPIDVDAEIVD